MSSAATKDVELTITAELSSSSSISRKSSNRSSNRNDKNDELSTSASSADLQLDPVLLLMSENDQSQTEQGDLSSSIITAPETNNGSEEVTPDVFFIHDGETGGRRNNRPTYRTETESAAAMTSSMSIQDELPLTRTNDNHHDRTTRSIVPISTTEAATMRLRRKKQLYHLCAFFVAIGMGVAIWKAVEGLVVEMVPSDTDDDDGFAEPLETKEWLPVVPDSTSNNGGDESDEGATSLSSDSPIHSSPMVAPSWTFSPTFSQDSTMVDVDSSSVPSFNSEYYDHSSVPSKSPSLSITSSSHEPSTVEDTTISLLSAPEQGFSFYVMGDVPYSPWEEAILTEQLMNMTRVQEELVRMSSKGVALRPPPLFLIHVGDLWQATRSRCTWTSFRSRASLFQQLSPIPAVILAGDNDIVDCPNPQVAQRRFQETFLFFEEHWMRDTPWLPATSSVTIHRNATRPELFSFIREGVLLLGVQLFDLRFDEDLESQDYVWYQEEIEVNIAFCKDQIAAALINRRANSLRAIFIVGHALRSPATRPFFEAIYEALLGFHYIPVIYLHGDGHVFKVDRRLVEQLDWPGFWDIQVDQGAFADPLLLQVAPLSGPLFHEQQENENEFALVLGNGMVRLDRQRGRYSEEYLKMFGYLPDDDGE